MIFLTSMHWKHFINLGNPAVTGKANIMDATMVGGLGGTFGGNPISCAAALEVFNIFEEGRILNNVTQLSKILHARLTEFKRKYKIVGDVRGLGVMQAIELVKDKHSKEPNKEAADKLSRFCLEHGLIFLCCGTFGNIIRLLMPLSTEANHLEIGLSIIEKGLQWLDDDPSSIKI